MSSKIHAAAFNKRYPSYWVNRRWNSETEIFDVGSKTRNAITDLVCETWQGRAVKHWNYSRLTVLDVERVENCDLFNDYSAARRQLVRKQIIRGKNCLPVGELWGSRGDVATTEILDESMEFLMQDLCLEVNEHYLFHGTPAGNIEDLTLNGFDVRHSNPNNMFGPGIYAGENSTVADVHADQKGNRKPPGHKLTMLLCRMLLGNVFNLDRKLCLRNPPPNFDSVIVDGRWRHREFIVYEDCHIYPEYVITYTRE